VAKVSAYFEISNLNGKHGVKEIKKEIDKIKGVISVSVNEIGRVAVDYDSTGTTNERLESDISKLGYEIHSQKNEKHIM